MKKLWLLSLLLPGMNGYAEELHNYDQIKAAVTTGKSIRIVVDFTQCDAPRNNNKFQAQYNLGVFTPNEMSVGEGRIIASLMHFTLNDPQVPGKAVYEYFRYRITEDNNVNLSFHVLSAVTYSPVTDELVLNCKIDKGAKIYS